MQPTISILIADDNLHIRKSLKSLIQDEPQFQILGITDSAEGTLALANKVKEAVLLIDVNMKPVSGFNTIQKISSQFPAIKIIGLSLHSERAYAKKLEEIGAHGYVAKSGSPQDLINCIWDVANGKNLYENN